MNHQEIEFANNILIKEIDELLKLKHELSNLRCNGQNTVTIYCQNRRLEIIDVSRETGWGAKQKRGMEMISLGLIKWYGAEIDRQELKVASWQAKLRFEVTK